MSTLIPIESWQPKIAIIGSPRVDVVGDETLAELARTAAKKLGTELANAGCKIMVYSSDPTYLEAHAVSGYVESSNATDSSIISYFPFDDVSRFPEEEEHPEKFDPRPDNNTDWEVAFYRSLHDADGALFLGGGESTWVAGHIAMNMELPIATLAHFGGKTADLWKHLGQDPTTDREAVSIMGSWNANTAEKVTAYLAKKCREKETERRAALEETTSLKQKAEELEKFLNGRKQNKKRSFIALIFLVAFASLLVLGLNFITANTYYIALFIGGLAIAGASGSTIRLMRPNAPENTGLLSVVVIGLAVGMVLSLMYLVPQLIADSSILFGDEDKKLDFAVKVPFISTMLLAFLAGLGFDYAFERLLRQSESGDLDNLEE